MPMTAPDSAPAFKRTCCGCALVAALAVLVLYGWRAHAIKQWQTTKRQELLAAVRRVEPLRDSLEAYRTEHGQYPKKLEELVPGHIAAIPGPGDPFKGEWRYERVASSNEVEDAYDLYVSVPREYTPWLAGGGGVLSFDDCFSYRPDGKYERLDHGGVLERIGEWGFYHE